MLLRDSARPATGQSESQGLRFPNTAEWIAQRRFHQIQDAKRGPAIGFHPVSEVLEKFRLEHGRAFSGRH